MGNTVFDMIKENQIILGLDISTKNTGWSVVKNTKNKPMLLKYGDIPRGKMSINEVLVNFESKLQSIINTYKPNIFAVEAPFVGINRQTIEKLCFVHGVMLLTAQKNKIIDVFGKNNFVEPYNEDVTDSISAAYTYILMDGKVVEKTKKCNH